MMKKTLLTISILSLLFILPVVYASVSTVTTSASTSRATTGTSVTVSVSVTATGDESGSVQLISSPSGITVSDPSSGQYQGVSLSTTPTTKTFTITAGTANTYTYYGSSGGTTSTESTIVFVDPSALTVTGSPSSTTTATGGGSFTLTINIQNSQSSAITTSYSLSTSGYSTTGDATSGTLTIGASSTTSLTWTVTTTTSSGTMTLSLGDNTNAFSTTVTVPSTTTTTTTETITSSSLLTTPGVIVTVVKGKATIVMPSIATGKYAVANIDKTEDVAFTQVIVYAKATINKMQIIATKLDSKPSGTADVSGTVYHYINVATNITNVDNYVNKTTVRFEVPQSWITANNVNKSTVALYRYSDNQWTKLTTTLSGEDTQKVWYDATSPGLSYFAIAGEVKTTVPGEEVTPTGEEGAEEGKQEVTGAKGKWWMYVVIVAGVAILGVVSYLIKSNKIKLDKFFPKKNSKWEELRKKYKN